MEQFLREIDHLMISARKKMIKGPIGNRRGKGLGNSMDFYGHRPYIPGDDIRKIDWKAYARTEGFYVREFTEERQMKINLVLDCSASMDFGIPNKLDTAKMIVLGLSYIALSQLDILSIYTVNERAEIFSENIRGKENFYELIPFINSIEPKGTTRLDSLGFLDNFPQGKTFIISDLFSTDIETTLDFLCANDQDVVVLQLLSKEEIDPDYNGMLKLVDNETYKNIRIQVNKRIKDIYKTKINHFIEKCKRICDQRDVKYVFSTSDMPYTNILFNMTEAT